MKQNQDQLKNRKWHLIDAEDQILGRLATKVANLLRGKDKPSFVPYADMGDYVIIINASKIRFTGRKLEQKLYHRHSGYPGSLKTEILKDVMKDKPEEVIRRAISGMLPDNKLKKFWLNRLYVYRSEEHPYKSKFEARSTKSETNSK